MEGGEKALHKNDEVIAAERTESNTVLPREFSKTSAEIQEKIDARKEGKPTAPAKGAGGKDDLKAELELDEHLIPIAELYQRLNLEDPESGLTSAEADRKQKTWGLNQLTPPAKTPTWIVFLSHMSGGFSLLLWAGAILCFVSYSLDSTQIDNLYLGSTLSVVVFLTGCFSFYQEEKSAAVMEGFKSMMPEEVSCRRDGRVIKMDALQLVPGDVITINTGDKIAADCRLISVNNFKVNQSSLTGEPDAISKKADQNDENPLESKNLAFFGTLASEGQAVGIVILTGDNSVMGRIANLASGTENAETPIHREIHIFIKLISGVAIGLGVLFFVIAFILKYDIITNLVFAIGIIVANVPEGLLATVTVSLTLTANRLATKAVLVKNLESVETLGSTSCICSDKTGTLTQNKMTASHCWFNGEIYDVKDLGTDLTHGATKFDPSDVTFRNLIFGANLANDAVFKADDENMAKVIQNRDLVNGNASDFAFVKLAAYATDTMGFGSIEDMRKKNPRKVLIPFNSKYKYMVSVNKIEPEKTGDAYTVVMKGAAEWVFGRCGYIQMNGKKVPIDDAIKTKFQDVYDLIGDKGERVIGFAIRELDPATYGPDFAFDTAGDPASANYPLGNGFIDGKKSAEEDSMTFVGLISLIDPPRLAVPKSVLLCQRAGVKVIMVTGDHPLTARAIARHVNIIAADALTIDEAAKQNKCTIAEAEKLYADPSSPTGTSIRAIVVPGTKLKNMSELELKTALQYEQIVFARTSPQQKLIIVEACQQIGHVVAVTGDGVNDSPALKQADIGCAMGIEGTAVSKEAADMILLTDDFSAIVLGIEEGRLIFDNLKKSICYTLTSNIPEILPFILFIVLQLPLGLTTVLILCVDLGTDMIPAISLAYELPESDIMDRPPRNADTDRLVTSKLISFAYGQIGVIQATAGFYAFFVVLYDYGFPMGSVVGAAKQMIPYGTLNNAGDKWNEKCPCGGRSDYLVGDIYNTYDGVDTPIKNGYLRYNENKLSSDDLEKYCSSWATEEASGKLEWDENWPYGWGCPYGSLEPQVKCKFENDKDSACYKAYDALCHAQTAFFVSIVIVQWADLLICKTRKLSIYHQGMSNTVMNYGLLSETCLAIILCYLPPLHNAINTRPLEFVHWLPAMPFSVMIFLYDEMRKKTFRGGISPGAARFVEKFTNY